VIYSAPNKESTFSEILISAVKFTFSHSNHHKGIKEPLWRSFLKICFSPYITHREAIEVKKRFLGKLSKFQKKLAVSQDMYGVKISNLVHTYFNIIVTSQKKISS